MSNNNKQEEKVPTTDDISKSLKKSVFRTLERTFNIIKIQSANSLQPYINWVREILEITHDVLKVDTVFKTPNAVFWTTLKSLLEKQDKLSSDILIHISRGDYKHGDYKYTD